MNSESLVQEYASCDIINDGTDALDTSAILRARSKVLLDSIYDEMIIWNMKQGDGLTIWQYIGMSPRDYDLFMQNPERWVENYLTRRNSSPQGGISS